MLENITVDYEDRRWSDTDILPSVFVLLLYNLEASMMNDILNIRTWILRYNITRKKREVHVK